jgi:hypothetical protein
MRKRIKKVLVICAMASLLIGQGGWVWAMEEETSPSPEPTPTQEQGEPTNTPAEAAPAESPTQTPTTEPTEVDSPTPSPSGDEELSPTPQPTETVTASEEQTSDPTATPSSQTTPSATASPTAAIEQVEGAVIDNKTETGGNDKQEPASSNEAESVTIETGKAIAWANLINLINANISGSQVKIFMLDKFEGSPEDIDLNQIWQDLGMSQTADTPQVGEDDFLVIFRKQEAEINNTVGVSAQSGGNQAGNSKGALIVTGDAIAIANIVNIVNSDLINSSFFIGIINVDGSLLGDLILPKPENFEQGQSCAGGQCQAAGNNNSGEVINSVSVAGNSGDNMVNNGNKVMIKTGDAFALINQNSWANNEGGDYFLLTLNNLGEWNGKIYNWSAPGSVDEGGSMMTFLINGGVNGAGMNQGQNTVLLNNLVTVDSQSGGNSLEEISGEATIKSGRSIALANLANFVNFSLVGRRWFYGIVNITSNWAGNIIFAYPDLGVAIRAKQESAGINDEVVYRINYGNLGYEEVRDGQIELELGDGMEYLEDNSLFKAEIKGSKVVWQINKVAPRSGGSFELKAKVVMPKSFSSRLVKPALAAEEGQTRIVKADISTSKIESNLTNNRSTAEVKISRGIGGSSQNGSTMEENNVSSGQNDEEDRLPSLEIKVRNNVNNFVYTGDVVTFEVKVSNKGARGYESYLIHQTADQQGNLLTYDEMALGEIKPGAEGDVSYGIVMDFESSGPEKVRSETKIVTRSNLGTQKESNTATTEYEVRPGLITKKTVGARKVINAEVLGINQAEASLASNPKKDYGWYWILGASLVSYVMFEAAKRLMERKQFAN